MQKRELFTPKFWLDALERTIATFAEVMSGFLIVDLVNITIDWTLALAVSGIAAGGALLKAIAVAARKDTESATESGQ